MQVSSNWLTTYNTSKWEGFEASQSSNTSIDNKKDDDTKPKSIDELDSEEKTLLAQLQASDTKVRAHESAHLSAAAGIAAGGANFTYERGPDGRMYAVAGEVPISVSEGKDPQDTLEKMRQVEAAAMAPADPSPQDHAVAASARSGELKALMDLQKERDEIRREEGLKQYSSIASQPIEQSVSVSITA